MSTQAIAQPKTRRLSPFVALLWEEWRQTRLPLLAGTTFAALIVAGLLVLSSGHPIEFSSRQMATMVNATLCLLFSWQAATLLFSGYGRNDMSLQFPQRLFALPVPSIFLAITRLGYGIAVVGVTFGLFGILLARFNTEFSPAYPYFFLAVETFVYLEAISWLLGRRPLLATGVGLALYLPFMLLTNLLGKGLPHEFDSALLASIPGLALFTAVALYAVRAQRHGGDTLFSLRNRVGVSRVEPQQSETPKQALFGFEWRRRGRWIPAFGITSFLLMAGMCSYGLRSNQIPFALLLGGACGLFAAGMFQTIVSERERVSGLQRFIMTRPSSTRNLARARLWALAAGYSLAFAALAMLLVAASLVVSRAPSLQPLHTYSPIHMLEKRVAILREMRQPVMSGARSPGAGPEFSGFLPLTETARMATQRRITTDPSSAFWPPIRFITAVALFYVLGWMALTQPLTTLLLLYVYLVAVNSNYWEIPPSTTPWGYTVWGVCVAVGVACITAIRFYRAYRRRVVSRLGLMKMLVAWFAFTYSAVFLCALAGSTLDEVFGFRSLAVAVAVIGATFTVPFWPFATIPLSIHRHRHQ